MRGMSFDFLAHYRVRLGVIDREIEAAAKDPAPKLVLLGDSLTAANPVQQISGVRVVNMGISGDEADHPEAGVLRRVDRVGRVQPCCVFLLVGGNDLNNRKPLDAYISQYSQVLTALQREAAGATIFVQSLLPTRDRFAHLLQVIREANVRLWTLADEKKCRWLDLFPLMTDDAGELRQEFTSDGIHLTPAAYGIWMGVLESAVGELPTIG
jgi:lysophospholipase L1-like esterase